MTTSIGTPSPADAQSADLGCRKLGATDIATEEQRQTLTELARQHTELAQSRRQGSRKRRGWRRPMHCSTEATSSPDRLS